jgi:GntR family transcriptional regulator, rspAB operon transcriptional repressor
MHDQKASYDINRQSLSEQVYEHIKRLILSGRIQGGERISEEKVARQFGVSRTPIREALRRLDEYGIIRVKPRSYAEVVGLNPAGAEQLSVVRAQLETLSVRLLTQYGGDEDFDALEKMAEICNRLILSGDVAGTFENDSRLHLELARRTCNPHLYEIFEKIDAKVQLLRLAIALPLEVLTDYVNQHLTIIHEMRNRNKTGAVDLMKRHILGQLKEYKQ